MDKQEVKKIAKLAQLELSEDELEKYAEQLSQILEYVNQLSDVKTDGVKITAQTTGLVNQLRQDKVNQTDKQKDLLAQAPELEGGGVKVKSVF